MLTTVSAPDATLVVIYADSLRWLAFLGQESPGEGQVTTPGTQLVMGEVGVERRP